MIAITFALRAESRGLVSALQRARKTEKVAIVHTGVGRDACEKETQKFLNKCRPDVLISSGFAGAIISNLQTGALIVGRNFSDPRLLSWAVQVLGPDLHRVNIVTTSSIIQSPVERSELALAQSAAAVDMETEFIARACASNSIPMLSFRVISDSVAQPLPLPAPMLFNIEDQKTEPLKLLAYLTRHPAAIPRLLRFSRQIAAARRNLSRALVRLLQHDPPRITG